MARSLTGLLIIRAWLEDESSKPLRAHLRATTDVSSGFEKSVTVADPEAVRRAVDGWLADMLAHRSSS